MARPLIQVGGVRRSELEDFVPFDTIPWAEQAEQLLACATESGFMGLRPASYVDNFVSFIEQACGLARGASIVDIGCGPGMFSLRLAAAGYSVIGIDIAEALVEHANREARERGLSARHERQSLQDFAIDEPAALTLIVNSIVNQMSPNELRGALARVSRQLEQGGQLLVELRLLPAAGSARCETVERSLLERSPFSPRRHMWIERKLFFDEARQAVTHHVIVEPSGSVAEYWSRSRLYERHEIEEMLSEAGFHVRAWFGREPGTPLLPEDEACVVWAVRNV